MNGTFTKNSIILLAIVFLFWGCEKEEHSIIKLDIANYSDKEIDTLKIYSSSLKHFYSILKEPIVFWNLRSGHITETRNVQDLEYCLMFKGYIKGDSIRGYWHFPSYPMDPAEPIIMPDGHYRFGIIECDTSKTRMVIGLISD